MWLFGHKCIEWPHIFEVLDKVTQYKVIPACPLDLHFSYLVKRLASSQSSRRNQGVIHSSFSFSLVPFQPPVQGRLTSFSSLLLSSLFPSPHHFLPGFLYIQLSTFRPVFTPFSQLLSQSSLYKLQRWPCESPLNWARGSVAPQRSLSTGWTWVSIIVPCHPSHLLFPFPSWSFLPCLLPTCNAFLLLGSSSFSHFSRLNSSIPSSARSTPFLTQLAVWVGSSPKPALVNPPSTLGCNWPLSCSQSEYAWKHSRFGFFKKNLLLSASHGVWHIGGSQKRLVEYKWVRNYFFIFPKPGGLKLGNRSILPLHLSVCIHPSICSRAQLW